MRHVVPPVEVPFVVLLSTYAMQIEGDASHTICYLLSWETPAGVCAYAFQRWKCQTVTEFGPKAALCWVAGSGSRHHGL